MNHRTEEVTFSITPSALPGPIKEFFRLGSVPPVWGTSGHPLFSKRSIKSEFAPDPPEAEEDLA